MKIRNGFVSNSSSSSFVIGIKGSQCKPTVEMFEELFAVPPTSPLCKMSKAMAKYLVNNAKAQDEQDILDNYGYDDIGDAIAQGVKSATLIKKGFRIFTVRASRNESEDPIELFIGNDGLGKIVTDNFMFLKEY